MQGYSRAALQVCEARRERFDELFAAYLATEQLANPDATRSRRGIAAQVAGGAWWFEQHRSVLQQCSRSPRLGTAHQLAAAVVEQLVCGGARKAISDGRTLAGVTPEVGRQGARRGVHTERRQAGGDRLVDARARFEHPAPEDRIG